jgi:hypothetical protein
MTNIYFALLIHFPFKGISQPKSKNSSRHNKLFIPLICFPHQNLTSPHSHLFSLFQTHSNKMAFSDLQGHLHICISHGLTFGLLVMQSVSCHNSVGTVCIKPASVRFEVLTAVLMKIQVFWDVMLCHWVNISCLFKVHSAFTVRVKQSKSNMHTKLAEDLTRLPLPHTL